MALLISAFGWILAQFARLLQLAISLPALVVSIGAVFVQGAYLVYDKIDSISATVANYIHTYLIDISGLSDVLADPLFGIASYCLALDVLLKGVVFLLGALAFLELLCFLLFAEYLVPCYLGIIVLKTALKIQKAIMPSGWSSSINIDCPDLLKIDYNDV